MMSFWRYLSLGIALNFSVERVPPPPRRAQFNLLWKTFILSLVFKTKSRKMLSLPFMAHRMSFLFKICREICLKTLEIHSHWFWKNYWALKWILSFVKRMSFVKTHELDLLMKENCQRCFEKFSSRGELCLFSRGQDCRVGANFSLRRSGPMGQDSQFPVRIAIAYLLSV